MWLKLVVLFFLSIPNGVLCKDALQNFVKNKKVKSFKVMVLNENSNWTEYRYNFDTSEIRELNDTKLNVGVVINANKQFDCRIGSDNVTLEGYSIDVLNWMKNALNFSVEYVSIDDRNISMELINGSVDIIICHSMMTDENFNVLELYPSITSKLIMVYKPMRLNFIKDIFILTFAGSLWLVFLVTMIVLGVCLRMSTRQYSLHHPKYEAWTWVDITLWSIAAACQQGLSRTPFGFSSCLIFFIGYIMSYLLYTGFAAAITSLLLQNDIYYKLDIKNIKSEELQLVVFEESRDVVKKLGLNFRKTVYTDHLSQTFKLLDNDNTVALLPEILGNQFMAENLQHTEIGDYRTSSLPNLKYRRGFYTLRNGGLREPFNLMLLRMQESGLLTNLLQRNLKPLPASGINYGYSSAGLEHVGSALFVLLGGMLMAILFLFAELTLAFYNRNQHLF